MCDLGHQRVVGVGVGEHAADAEQHFGDGQGGRPLVTQDVEADGAVGVDVWVVDTGGEVDFGRLERVVSGEVDGQEEDAGRVGRVAGAHDGRLPVEQILSDGASRARGRGVASQVRELLVDSLERHVKIFTTATPQSQDAHYKIANTNITLYDCPPRQLL